MKGIEKTGAGSFREGLRELYYGDERRSKRFRVVLLAFDLLTIGYFIISSMLDPNTTDHTIDYLIASVLALDYTARLAIANRPWRAAIEFTAITDLVVILSLVASAFVENLGFLRVARMLRLLRSYHVVKELRSISPYFRRNEEIIQSSVNLLVFIFVVTAIVYVTEGHQNPSINTYLDALYFTVATLTTTGFGDITLTDSFGRLLAVVIMVFGVALFLRLVQTIFRPQKVSYTCPDCGLTRHDPDAVHCKHCGRTIHIRTEGEWL
ncbi:potassium channel family protein [Stappia sp. F7233]|uniref:Potassium channel family protein n=1 Tax=Stappia albiluteola TaxID=2758565 RepID=A0A839A9V7_9HYPH|nr:potassium channel family protein [Stappia albiluteola]MBA5775895.1 potassium channel family protein [Stappia albiluteola]